MKKIDLSELKNIQLNILDDVAEYCKNENLTYFLAYGTLIGAIRHDGYIPWDDDIDILMPRKDYDFFLQNYNNSTNRYKVLDYEIDSKYLYPFGKVMDKKTVLNENCRINYDLGVNIDIFPLDKVDESGNLLKKERLIRKIIFLKTMPWSKSRSFIKNIILIVGRILFSIIPLRVLIEKTEKLGKSMMNTDSTKVSVPVDGAYNVKVWEKKWFDKAEYHIFEGKEYMIPVGYDEWLRSVYGDYMQLPPEGERASLHDFEAYWRD